MKQSLYFLLGKHALLVDHLVLKYNAPATFFEEKKLSKNKLWAKR